MTVAEKLTKAQREALRAIAPRGHVLWPRACESLKQFGHPTDDRTHFMAPIDDAFALFHAGFITSYGEITPAGRLALENTDDR